MKCGAYVGLRGEPNTPDAPLPAGLAVRVAAITLGLAGRVILNDLRDAVLVGQLSRIGFGFRRRRLRAVTFGFLRNNAGLFVAFCLLAFGPALFPGGGGCKAHCLPGFERWLGGFLGGEKSLQESGLGFDSRAAAVS